MKLAFFCLISILYGINSYSATYEEVSLKRLLSNEEIIIEIGDKLYTFKEGFSINLELASHEQAGKRFLNFRDSSNTQIPIESEISDGYNKTNMTIIIPEAEDTKRLEFEAYIIVKENLNIRSVRSNSNSKSCTTSCYEYHYGYNYSSGRYEYHYGRNDSCDGKQEVTWDRVSEKNEISGNIAVLHQGKTVKVFEFSGENIHSEKDTNRTTWSCRD